MYCPSCGKEIIEGAGFCAHCGTAVPTVTEVPQHTLTFVRYDKEGPELSIALPSGESITLTDRDRQSVSLPGGTHMLTLTAGPQQETLEVALDEDIQADLYWSGEEQRFVAVVDTLQRAAANETAAVRAEKEPAVLVNEAWAKGLAQVDRTRDIIAGILELAAAIALLFLPIVNTPSLFGISVSMNLMELSQTMDLYLSYGVSSIDGAVWGMIAFFVSWFSICGAAISGIAAFVTPSKISYSLYINMSGPLSFLLSLVSFYIISESMGLSVGIGLWLPIILSAAAWVVAWKNFTVVRTELKKVPRKQQK